jgi:hypothetical protein
MNRDPQGYYALLDLAWDASPAAIHAAYRRKARVLHPDIPVTGDAAAFVVVKEAYEVLADPLRRAAYDRAARSLDRLRTVVDAAQEIHPDPPPAPSVPRTRGPRLSDLPLVVWAGLAIVSLVAGTEAVLHLTASPDTNNIVDVPAHAPTVSPQVAPAAPHPIRLTGVPNVYVIPAGAPALVYRYDAARRAFVPIGQLPPFSAAQALHVLRDNGLVEIRLTNTATGFIDAARLAPGNAAAARQAFCAYDAGPPPANGEVLARSGLGTGQTVIQNRTGQPIVVKLRDHDGTAAVTVFLEPGGDARVSGVPDGSYRPEYAIGELWSRACNAFAAGMRAQRFPGFAPLLDLRMLTIPPELPGDAVPADISDQEFEHE